MKIFFKEREFTEKINRFPRPACKIFQRAGKKEDQAQNELSFIDNAWLFVLS